MVREKITAWSHNTAMFVPPKDRCRKRKAQVVRNFPPHCGRNASPPEGKKRMTDARIRVKCWIVIEAENSHEKEELESKDDAGNAAGTSVSDDKDPSTEEVGDALEDKQK